MTPEERIDATIRAILTQEREDIIQQLRFSASVARQEAEDRPRTGVANWAREKALDAAADWVQARQNAGTVPIAVLE